MATVLDLVTAALRDLGVLAAGEVPSAGDANLALAKLNRRVNAWNAQGLATWAISRVTHSITANDGSYTIGTGADINTPWPVFVSHVNLIDTNQDPDAEIPLTVLTEDEYAALSPKALTSTFPSRWYFDRAYSSVGRGNVIYWPTPTGSGLQAAVYVPTQVGTFALATDVALPPGYELMYVTTLAEDLALPFGRRDMLTDLRAAAQRAEGTVRGANFRPAHVSCDPALLGGNRRLGYDIRNG